MERFTGTAMLDEPTPATSAWSASSAGHRASPSTPASPTHFIAPLDGFSPAHQSGGDVLARYAVRVDEVRASLALLASLVDRSRRPRRCRRRSKDETVLDRRDGGVGIAEGWRGAVVHRVELDEQGGLPG